MSRPRLLRTDTMTPRSATIFANRSIDRVRRPLERDAGGGVQRNQVHLRTSRRATQLRELPRVLRRVVDAGEQHVLERDPAALA